MPFDIHVEAILPQIDSIRPTVLSAARDIQQFIIELTSSRTARIGARLLMLLCLSLAFAVAVQVLKAAEGLSAFTAAVFRVLSWAWMGLMMVLVLVVTVEISTEYIRGSAEVRRTVRATRHFVATLLTTPSASPAQCRGPPAAVNPADFTPLAELTGPLELEKYILAATESM